MELCLSIYTYYILKWYVEIERFCLFPVILSIKMAEMNVQFI